MGVHVVDAPCRYAGFGQRLAHRSGDLVKLFERRVNRLVRGEIDRHLWLADLGDVEGPQERPPKPFADEAVRR